MSNDHLVPVVRTVSGVWTMFGLTAAREAQARLRRHGYSNVEAHVGNGCHGWPWQASYDKILR